MTEANQSAQASEGSTDTKTPKIGRRLGEEALTQKIDNRGRPVVFLEGTLEFVDDACIERHPELADKKGKQVVQKVCEGDYEGEDAPIFFVATSDMHQTFYKAENGMRQKMKNANAKAKRAAKKAKAEQDAAELAEHRSATGG